MVDENGDFRDYLAWVEAGNTAEPAEVFETVATVAQPTAAEMQAQIAALQAQLATVMSMFNSNTAD
jgi:hypothetical protein